MGSPSGCVSGALTLVLIALIGRCAEMTCGNQAAVRSWQVSVTSAKDGVAAEQHFAVSLEEELNSSAYTQTVLRQADARAAEIHQEVMWEAPRLHRLGDVLFELMQQRITKQLEYRKVRVDTMVYDPAVDPALFGHCFYACLWRNAAPIESFRIKGEADERPHDNDMERDTTGNGGAGGIRRPHDHRV